MSLRKISETEILKMRIAKRHVKAKKKRKNSSKKTYVQNELKLYEDNIKKHLEILVVIVTCAQLQFFEPFNIDQDEITER